MAKKYTYRITAIDRERQLVTILFNEDETTHWAFDFDKLPQDELGFVLHGEPFRSWCAERIFPEIEKREKLSPNISRLVQHEIKNEPTDISVEIDEIRTLIKLMNKEKKA